MIVVVAVKLERFAPSRGRELKLALKDLPNLTTKFAPSRGRELKLAALSKDFDLERSPPRGGGN